MSQSKIVTLCGSTKFKDAFIQANRSESAKGNLVFTVCWFTHVDGPCPEEEEETFRRIHFEKINKSNEIFVLNIGGYIGQHTRLEIEYAESQGVPIRYLEGIKG